MPAMMRAKYAGLILNRKQNTIVLENQETQIILDLETGESLGKDTLAFDHSQIILKAFHHVLETMMHDPRVLLVLGLALTITDARKVFAKFLGIDFKNIDHSNLKKALNDHLEAIGDVLVVLDDHQKSTN